MKKNLTIKAAGALAVLTLVTSCFVGGTFAKYVTAGDSTDTARVAKFGVEVTGQGDEAKMFSNEYSTDEKAGYEGDITVESTVNVVAPGTQGSLTDFSIKGTPEVAVRVSYTVDKLELTNWTYKADDLDATEEFYCPIVITVNNVDVNGLNYENVDKFIEAIEAEIAKATKEYDPGTDLSTALSDDANAGSALSIRWAWAFEGDGNGKQTDAKDTYLGEQAAKDETNAAKISLKVSCTVTQID